MKVDKDVCLCFLVVGLLLILYFQFSKETFLTRMVQWIAKPRADTAPRDMAINRQMKRCGSARARIPRAQIPWRMGAERVPVKPPYYEEVDTDEDEEP